jgi:hypothetical protein
MFEVIKTLDGPIWHFDYPRVSIAWYIGLLMINYNFQSEFLLTYLCLLVLAIMAIYSDFYDQKVVPYTEDFFYRPEVRNPMIQADHKIRTADQMSQEYHTKNLMDAGNELK